MADTEKNLKDAFAGESQANRKYLAYAQKAEQEGFANVARLFRITAEAETLHANGHLRMLKAIGSTAENLKAAIEGETFEATDMYPSFLEKAEAENHPSARMIDHIMKVEAIHARLYSLALESIAQGKDLTEVSFYMCPVCGYIEFGNPPENCPICNAKGEKFIKA